MQDFSTRFMRTYDSIPADVKPPPSVAKLHYVDALSSELTLLLRERRFVSFTDMMDDAIEVQVNISTSNSDAKIYSLFEAVKALVKLSRVDKNQIRN